jgi:flavorubredoxin
MKRRYFMKPVKIKEGIFWVGAMDWDRRLFDSLIPLPDGTSYNAYLIYGSEKTVLIDTVDPSKVDILLSHVRDVQKIDFIVSQHAEQDHSGAIPQILDKYREAKVITTPKGKGLLIDHLHIDGERIITVSDGETLSIGGKTLEFLHTPWVHWPETMVTYIHEDKVLFTCDLFGSHLATSSLYSEEDWKVCEAAKRYYAEVMMPFRVTIRRHIERLEKYQIDTIAASHGPVYNDPQCIIQSHREWVSDKVSNTVILPYVTMHGSTQLMVEYITESLSDKGIHVERFNLPVTDMGKLAIALVDAATIVFGSPTVLVGAHPLVMSASFLVNSLRPKLKFASIICSHGWGGKTVEQITGMLSNLKLEMLEPVIIKGKPKDDDFKSLEKLASEIADRHKKNSIV